MKIMPPEISAGSLQSRKTTKSGGSKDVGSKSGDDKKSAGVGGGDSIDISSTASQMKVLGAKLKAMPDVRTERVQSLKAEIERGNYNPAASDIAQSLMDSIRLFG